MSHITGLGRACVLFAMMGGMQGVYAQGLAADAASAVQQASAPVAAIPALDPQVQSVQPQAGETTGQSTVDELQRQMQAHALTEMRTNYNGSYGASLLFNVKDGAYFVALFQQKAFWRVIKTHDDARAEAIYRDFSHQAARLAVNELRAAKLEAQKAQTDRRFRPRRTAHVACKPTCRSRTSSRPRSPITRRTYATKRRRCRRSRRSFRVSCARCRSRCARCSVRPMRACRRRHTERSWGARCGDMPRRPTSKKGKPFGLPFCFTGRPARFAGAG